MMTTSCDIVLWVVLFTTSCFQYLNFFGNVLHIEKKRLSERISHLHDQPWNNGFFDTPITDGSYILHTLVVKHYNDYLDRRSLGVAEVCSYTCKLGTFFMPLTLPMPIFEKISLEGALEKIDKNRVLHKK